MGTGCAAVNCSNRGNTHRMHRFPANADRKRQWAAMVNRQNWEPSRNSYLCEAHFEPDQYENGRADGRMLLKATAVPTLFPHHRKPKPGYRSHNQALIRIAPRPVSVPNPEQSSRDSPANVPQVPETTQKAPNAMDHTYFSSQPRVNSTSGTIGDNSQLTKGDTVLLALQSHNMVALCPGAELKGYKGHKAIVRRLGALEKRLRATQRLNREYRRTISRLRSQEKLREEKLKGVFGPDQLYMLGHVSARDMQWTKETMDKGMRLLSACGEEGYGLLLEQGHPLPSVRTLRPLIHGPEKHVFS